MIKEWWTKIPYEWRKEITSFSHTFIGTFIVVVGTDLSNIAWSRDALIALAVSALRSAWKAAFNKIILKK